MSDSSKRIKPASVAAFLFMPQFRLSFQHLSFIMPVFIRTVAVMFEQAGLLPPNHPAIHYGVEGVRKYKFSELLGEAWYTLRSTHATPYQWSLFVSVVMMIVFAILSAVTTVLNISGMLVSTAHAQIFDSAAGATNTASVASAGYTPLGGTFDMSVVPVGANAHADYGIMILDKILREGVVGVGGSLQNALGSLMQIYNTGVLVVAGIMLFWAVLSVVVDTAKTGQIGGGRHNMVWAPMRIVFALGLLIPLGASGFSSGQFMVMKLAEWGSNFGTRGWVQYVTSVQNNNMIGQLGMSNMSGLVNQYVKMWVCRISYNGYTYQTMGPPPAPPATQIVTDVPNTGIVDTGTQNYGFTNTTNGNLCGTVTYQTQNDPALQAALTGTDLTAKAVATYKIAMRAAYTNLFVTAPTTPGGTLTPQAKALACTFVSAHLYGGTSGTPADPLATECGSSTTAPGTYPNTSVIASMIQGAYNDVTAASNTQFLALNTFVSGGTFMTEVKSRGWAGMGMWYHQISELNAAVSSMSTPPVAISDGVLSAVTLDPSLAGANDPNSQVSKVHEIILKYNDWWEQAPAKAVNAVGTPAGAQIQPTQGSIGWTSIASAVASGNVISMANAFINMIINQFAPDPFFGILAPGSHLYPLAQLAVIGNWLIGLGIVINAGTTVLGMIGSLVPVFGRAGIAFEASPLASFMGTLGNAMMLSGAMLAFYIPILPFIRVLHAVLTWMISVFEAVMMVPIAALAHLTTEGEGLAAGAKGCWILWLNVLLRPILTVVGYVAALLVFNTFIMYFHSSFATTMVAGLSSDGTSVGFISRIAYTFAYVGIVYTAANSIFKLLDIIPSAMMRWMGGSADTSFDDNHQGLMSAGANLIRGSGQGRRGGGGGGGGGGGEKTGVTGGRVGTQADYNGM